MDYHPLPTANRTEVGTSKSCRLIEPCRHYLAAQRESPGRTEFEARGKMGWVPFKTVKCVLWALSPAGLTPVMPFEGLANARSICWMAQRPKAAPSRCSVAPMSWPPLSMSDGACLFVVGSERWPLSVKSECRGLLLSARAASDRPSFISGANSCLQVLAGDTNSGGRRWPEVGTKEGTPWAALRLEESSTI